MAALTIRFLLLISSVLPKLLLDWQPLRLLPGVLLQQCLREGLVPSTLPIPALASRTGRVPTPLGTSEPAWPQTLSNVAWAWTRPWWTAWPPEWRRLR